MATAQDVLKTIVRLEGAEAYQSGMKGVSSAVENAAAKQRILMQMQAQQAASYGVLGATLLGLSGKWVKLAGTMEQSNIAFTTLLKSGSQAKQFVKDLQQFAAATPFEFMDLQGQAKRLLAFGFAAKDVIPMLTTLGDAVGSLGGGQETLGRVIVAMGQVNAKGRLMGQEMLQLAEAGIPVYQIFQDELGLTGDEMRRVGEKGIEASRAIPALMRGLDKAYGGGMAAQMGTLDQSLSTLADNLAITGAALGKGMLVPIKATVQALTAMTGAVGKLSEEQQSVIGTAIGLVGTIATIKGAIRGYQAAQIGINLLLAEKAKLELANAAATNVGTNATLAAAAAERQYLEARGGSGIGGAMLGNRGAFEPGWYAAQQAQRARMGEGVGAAATGASIGSKIGAGLAGLLTPMNLLIAGLFGLYAMYQTMVVPAMRDMTDSLESHRDMSRTASANYGIYYQSRSNPNLKYDDGMPTPEKWEADTGWKYSGKLGKYDPAYKAARAGAMEEDLGPVKDPNFKRYENSQVKKLMAEDVEYQRSWLEELQRGYENANVSASALRDTNAQIAQLMNEEAEIRAQAALELYNLANLEGDSEKHANLVKEAREQELAAFKLRNDAAAVSLETENKILEAVKKQGEEKSKLAGILTDYNKLAYGEGSQQHIASVGYEANVLSLRAQEALIMGDIAEAYSLAAESMTTYKEIQDAIYNGMEKILGVGDAYTDYLRSIGMDKQADAYQRNVMATQYAQKAQFAFSVGDIQGGYRAAAQAETLARTGDDDLLGRAGYRKGALTGALSGENLNSPLYQQYKDLPYTGQINPTALSAERMTITINNNYSAGPDYQKRESKRIQGDMNNTQYYSSFTW